MFESRRTVETQQLLALDALRANVMIANADLTITYVNPSVMAMLKRAEADLMKDLPRFSTATLIGSNIDVFHKNPSHQRDMLARLEAERNATITVGKWKFDLIVNPLKENGRRLGFVVEWADAKERLLNLDDAAQIAAISRSQAVIEFSVDGTILDANDNFLHLMGYTMDEVQGRKHAMFVDPAMRESQGYLRDSVQAVAASAEQLAASIDEIAASMATSLVATEQTYEQAVSLGRSTDSHAGAAQAMNGIVALIRNIASQINLLALNATIEAARAGDAGKGFAVVASEVKNLAIQAAKATERISTEIDGIQSTSAQVAGALSTIREAVTTVRESVTLTASAVEEQSSVTRTMSASMQSATNSVSTVGRNIGQIASAMQEATAAVVRTRQAAEVLVR